MSSMYNVSAQLSVNNTGFIAGFASAERAVNRFNKTMEKTATLSTASMSRINKAGRVLADTSLIAGNSTKGIGNGADDSSKKIDNLSSSTTRAQSAMNKLGKVAGAVGKGSLALVGAGAYSLYKTLDTFSKYESAMAGVKKVVDATDKEFRSLDKTFRQMSRTMPATYEEIAGVAESAGQLGVAKEDIKKFTKTMIMLGTSTNLSAEEASSSLAKMMNIMGTNQKDVDRLGSTLVKLGNNGASTEKDIVALAMRLAGMGKELGIRETEVMSLASTLSDLGVSAEMGGSAISKTMSNMKMSLEKASDYKEISSRLKGLLKAGELTKAQFQRQMDKLNKEAGAGLQFAKLLGLDKPDEVKNALKLFQKDAYGALVKMVGGLENVIASGGNVTEVLKNMKVNDVQALDAFKRMIGGSEKLKQSAKTASDEWKKNSALTTEASQRYKTFESQVKMAWNGIRNIMANIGGVFAKSESGMMQVIVNIINKVEKMTDKFFDAEGNITAFGENFVKTIKRIGVVVGIIGAIAGAFLVLGPTGAVVVGVTAGLGLIGLGVKKLIDKLDPNRSGLDKATDALDKSLSKVTRDKAEKFLKLRDSVNTSLTQMAVDSNKVSKKMRNQIMSDVQSLTDEILNEINKKESKIVGITERLLQSATGSERKMLEENLKATKAHFARQREIVKDAQANIKKTLDNAVSRGSVLSQSDYSDLQVLFGKLDKEYKMHVSKNITEMAKLSQVFSTFDSNTSFEKVQGNLTKFTKTTVSSLKELEKGFNSQKGAIESSGLPIARQNELIASLTREYEGNRLGILKNLEAYEKSAQKINDKASAMKGLSDKEKEFIGISNESSKAIQMTDAYMASATGTFYESSKAVGSVSEGIKNAQGSFDSAQQHVQGLADKFNETSSKVQHFGDTLNELKNSTPATAQSLGQQFISSIENGVGMVDMGSLGKVTIDKFVAGLKNGQYGVAEASIAQMNALRSGLNQSSLTPDGEQKVLQFISGLTNKKATMEEVANQLGLNIKSKMNIDLGEAGTYSMNRFIDGIKTGEFGITEIMSMYSQKLKDLSTVNLNQVGMDDIATLNAGIKSGFITTDQVIKTFTDGMSAKTKVNLTGSGYTTIDSLVKGYKSGEIGIETFLKGVKSTVSSNVNTNIQPQGVATMQSYSKGLFSGVPSVKEIANGAKLGVQNIFGSTNDGNGGKNAIEKFRNNLLFGTQSAVKASESVVFKTQSTLGKANDGEGGKKAINKMSNDILLGGEKAKNASQSVVNKTKTVLGRANDGGGGTKVGTSFANNINAKGNSAKTAGANLAINAKNGLKGSSSDTKNLGNDFGQGFINGIKEKASAVWETAKSLARKALDAIQRTQRSHSPSKITNSLGGDFGDGYIIGINDKVKSAVSVAKGMASSAISAMSSEASRNAIDMNELVMPSNGISSMNSRISHELSTKGNVEISGKQPANINVNVGGQQFETFSDNIYNNSIKRLNLKENYSV